MNINYKSLWIILGIMLLGLTCGCSDDHMESIPQGVQIKAFMPVAVMENTEMVITGNNLDKVTAVIFPEGIEVSTFEVVTANMIKVTIPAGVATGKLRLDSPDGIVESVDVMRPARPQINSMEPGDEVRELEVITFKGEDLECIDKIIFPGEGDEDIVVGAMSFMRKSSGHLKVRVPAGVRGGMASIRLIAANGEELLSNEINLLAAAKEPDGSVKCYIKHIGSERYLTRNIAEEYPRVMSFTGSRDQEFSFIPVDEMPGNYYLKNSATGEYLVIGDENDWRMIWVFDPTTITFPERGMYQVMNISGSDNIQIKNVGSGMLGTDSNDENSEVYGNKWGETEPRFLWSLDILSGSFDIPDASLIIWEGEQDFGEWYDFYLEAEQFADLTVGSVIRITIQASDDGWSNFDLQDADWADFDGFAWKHPQDEWPDGIVNMNVTEDVYNRIKAGGLRIRGAYFTLYKVEITGGEPPREPSNLLWEGEQPFDDWYIVKIPADYLSHLQAEDIIRIWFTPEDGAWPQMDLRDADDVSFPGFEWLGLEEFTDGYVDFQMNESIRDRLSSGGLLIRGSHYTLLKVEIL